MARYHINPTTGKAGVCRAKVACRFALPEEAHYPTKAAAEDAVAAREEERARLDGTFLTTTRRGDAPIVYGGGEEAQEEYRLAHQAPTDDGYNAPLTALDLLYPQDVADHPNWYGLEHEETLRQLKRVWASPRGGEELVTIYRGVPKGVKTFRHGDWVALSHAYAEGESYGTDEDGRDGEVISTRVPAKALYNEGNSLEEWGLDASKIPALTIPPQEAPAFYPHPHEAAHALEERYPGTTITLEGKDGYASLAVLKVPEGERGRGTGTRIMEDLTAIADERGWTLTLTPSTDFGGSSVGRLRTFYKRFGFRENKGAAKDWSTRDTMVRPPASKAP